VNNNYDDDDDEQKVKEAETVDDVIAEDPLFQWFVDTDNEGEMSKRSSGTNPQMSPASSCYKSAQASPPPPPPDGEDGDADSESEGTPTKPRGKKLVLQEYFIGSPDKDKLPDPTTHVHFYFFTQTFFNFVKNKNKFRF